MQAALVDPADPDAVSHALQRIQTPTRIVPLAAKRSRTFTCACPRASTGQSAEWTHLHEWWGTGGRPCAVSRISVHHWPGEAVPSCTVAAQGSWTRSTAWAEGVSCGLSFCHLWQVIPTHILTTHKHWDHAGTARAHTLGPGRPRASTLRNSRLRHCCGLRRSLSPSAHSGRSWALLGCAASSVGPCAVLMRRAVAPRRRPLCRSLSRAVSNGRRQCRTSPPVPGNRGNARPSPDRLQHRTGHPPRFEPSEVREPPGLGAAIGTRAVLGDRRRGG